MLDKIRGIVGSRQQPDETEPVPGIKLKSPKHIAMTIDGIVAYTKLGSRDAEQVHAKAIEALNSIISLQAKKNIPIMTFYLLGDQDPNKPSYEEFLDFIVKFLENLKNHEAIKTAKISVIGKWYDLPGRVVEAVKEVQGLTRDNSEYYINFCLNYNGQEEVVDACKLLVRQVMASKIDISQIDKSTIKENIYTSYFPPPDLIIKNGYKKYTKGLLLWDSPYSIIYFSGRMFPEFRNSDLDKAIEYWRRS